MRGKTIRVYHCLVLGLVCVGIFIFNTKTFKERSRPDSRLIRNNLQTGQLNRTDHGISGTGRGMSGHPVDKTMVQNLTLSQKDNLDARMRLLDEGCQKLNGSSGVISELTGNRDLGFVYCIVPKAGCTMWLRILQYIAGQRGRTDHPMSLDKYDVHYHSKRFRQKFYKAKDAGVIKDSFRSMTVRNPYTRLWSAYIDKLLLPDFWQTKGKAIIGMVRHKPGQKSLQCGHDVTFPEFIEYVIRTGHSLKYVDQDKHWLPASDICDPCAFKPEVISKQETFMSDLYYIVNKIRIPYMFEKLVTKDPVVFEIADEVTYNFKIHHHHSMCINVYQMCEKMWKAFQYNGYIPPSETFDNYVKSDRPTKDSFLSVIQHVRETFNVTNVDKKRWRREAIKHAYSSLTEAQMHALAHLYKLDFELFGYDIHPDFI